MLALVHLKRWSFGHGIGERYGGLTQEIVSANRTLVQHREHEHSIWKHLHKERDRKLK